MKHVRVFITVNGFVGGEKEYDEIKLGGYWINIDFPESLIDELESFGINSLEGVNMHVMEEAI